MVKTATGLVDWCSRWRAVGSFHAKGHSVAARISAVQHTRWSHITCCVAVMAQEDLCGAFSCPVWISSSWKGKAHLILVIFEWNRCATQCQNHITLIRHGLFKQVVVGFQFRRQEPFIKDKWLRTKFVTCTFGQTRGCENVTNKHHTENEWVFVQPWLDARVIKRWCQNSEYIQFQRSQTKQQLLRVYRVKMFVDL